MSILGSRVLRIEDHRMLTDGATYVADLRFESEAHLKFVRSTVAYGRLVDVETDEAKSMPGVIGVFTAVDLDLDDIRPIPAVNQHMSRPPLARDHVRFVGEPVAVIVAETALFAEDAAEQVIIEIDAQEPVKTPEEAAVGDRFVHDDAGTNLAFELSRAAATRTGDSWKPHTPQTQDLDLSQCEVVVEASFRHQRLAAVPLEPRSAAAVWNAKDQKLTFYASTQAPHRVRDALATMIELEADAVRVITPDVGGGFGAKGSPTPEELLVGYLSRMLDRPVVWTESRAENLGSSVHGRAQYQRVRLGGTRHGVITHYQLDVSQDAGAYPIIGAFLPTLTAKVFTGCYRIANAAFSGRSYTTNKPPIAAYRGAGRPEAIFAIERGLDMFATRIGIDPAEVRRLNFITTERFPYTTAAGNTYDTGDFPKALKHVLDAVDYEALRNEQVERRSRNDSMLLGIGIGSYVESTSMGTSELGELELASDGSLVVRSGATSFGQGHNTCWAMIASQVTGVPIDAIRVVSGDTQQISMSGLTAASRSAQLAGSAVLVAAQQLVRLAQQCAADLLEAATDDVSLNVTTGTFAVAGSPQPDVSWADIAQHRERAGSGVLSVASDFVQSDNTYAFGCHIATVEIDSLTGEASLRSLHCCDDAGRLINPIIAEGQVHGGIAQGAAQVLFEAVVYDSDANPITTNLVDYPVISATELPRFELTWMQTPTPLNPLAAKGVGESGTVGSGPAILNAVCDALAHRGIDHIEMPTTPQRIYDALSGARS